jgi:hypothetical protein
MNHATNSTAQAEEPSHIAMAYYLLVLAALGYIIKLAPMVPPGR